MENDNFEAAYEAEAQNRNDADLMAWANRFAYGDEIAQDKPKDNTIKIPVNRPPADQGGERPFFVPSKADRDRGEGGVFGNAAQALVNGAVEGVNNTLEAAYQSAIFWDQNFGGKVMPAELPDIPKPFDVPDTTVNTIVSTIGQFVVPFGAAGKAMGAAKLGTNVAASFPKAAKIARPMIQGAIADFSAFDGHEARLSNLIESVPALQNPVSEYLAASEDDSELEGRFKNAVEGLGVGAAADGLFKCLSAVKAARKARRIAKEENLKSVEERFVPKVAKEDLSALGDPDGELLVKGGAETSAEAAEKAGADGTAVEEVKKDFVGEISKEDGFTDVSFGKLSDKYKEKLNFIRREDGLPLIENDELIIPANVVRKLREKRIGLDGKTPDEVADILANVFHKEGNSVFRTKHSHIQGIADIHQRESLSEIGFVSVNPATGETVIKSVYPEKTKRVIKKFKDINIGEAPVLSYATDVHQPAAGRLSVVNVNKSIAKTAKSVNSENVYINFARIDTPDDIKKVMAELADASRESIDKARRGKMTFGDIEQAAKKWTDGQEDAFKILQERRVGEPLNAEQSFAARQLWAASAQKVKELSQRVLESPTDANQFMFRKMLATHAAIQKEIIAARTETARALAQWKMPAGAPEEMASQLRAMLDYGGGDELTRKMAKDVMDMTNAGMVKEVENVINKGWGAKTIDTWNEARIAGLLTNTTTHIVNFMSNTLNLGVAMADDLTTAAYAKMFGAENAARATDALARLHGMVDGFKDGLRYSWKTIKAGASENPYATKFDRPPVIRSETYGLDKNSFWGRVVDFGGTAIRLPYRFLEASDDFFKAVAGRGALYVEAAQKAQAEVLSGKLTKDAMKARVADLIENPTVAMRANAKTMAEYLTFTGEPSELTKHIGAIANKYPLVRFFLPFTKTPGNVLDFAMQHSAFAPLSRKFRADIAAGGIRADRAMGQMATGVAISMVGLDAAMNGLITGGGPSGAERQALLRTGWQPYSVKIGDKYYSFARFDPVATDLSIMADIADLMIGDRYGESGFDENDDTDMMSASGLIALKVANAVLNKTYLSGLMDIVDAVADPTEAKARALVANGLISMVPGLSSVNALSAAVARTTDPYAKDAANVIDRLKAQTPGLSKDVPDRLDLFGRKIKRATGSAAYDMFVPVRVSEESQEPIDREILAQGAFIPMPNRKISVGGGKIDLKTRPALYNEYVGLAGNGLKLDEFDGMGVKDFLNAVVSGKKPEYGYESLSDGGPDAPGSKANFIRAVVNAGRKAAIAEMLERHPDLQAEAEAERDIMRRMKSGITIR